MPFRGQFEDTESFIEALSQRFDEDNYDNVIFMSAWTRLWPIQQINDSLRQYLSGGGRFTLYTGNSFRSTSIEAMEHLMDLVTEFPSQVHVYVCAQNTGSAQCNNDDTSANNQFSIRRGFDLIAGPAK